MRVCVCVSVSVSVNVYDINCLESCQKHSPKETIIPVDDWEELAHDRLSWRNISSKSVKQLDMKQIKHQKLKCVAHRGEDIDILKKVELCSVIVIISENGHKDPSSSSRHWC